MLDKLVKPKSQNKNRKRIGRGPGSGTGKTSGKGHKGQKSRSGYKRKAGFEGGQTPLFRRLPKKGFCNIHKTNWSIVNLSQINECKKLKGVSEITPELLSKVGLIRNSDNPVKLLGKGDLIEPLHFKVGKVSRSVAEKIRKAGGKISLI